MQTYGRIDILLNNVGILAVGGQVWDRHFNVNVKSMFLTCKYVLPIMAQQGHGGAIVNTSSIASIRYTGYPSVAYNASKGG